MKSRICKKMQKFCLSQDKNIEMDLTRDKCSWILMASKINYFFLLRNPVNAGNPRAIFITVIIISQPCIFWIPSTSLI